MDTTGFNITANNIITGPGTVTKIGSGQYINVNQNTAWTGKLAVKGGRFTVPYNTGIGLPALSGPTNDAVTLDSTNSATNVATLFVNPDNGSVSVDANYGLVVSAGGGVLIDGLPGSLATTLIVTQWNGPITGPGTLWAQNGCVLLTDNLTDVGRGTQFTGKLGEGSGGTGI